MHILLLVIGATILVVALVNIVAGVNWKKETEDLRLLFKSK